MSLRQSVRVGSVWVVLPMLLALACGQRDIKKPPNEPDEDPMDAQAMPPPVKLDSASKPNTLTDGPVADAPQQADGPSPGDAGPDGPLECVPACGTGQTCNNGQCESVCAAGMTVCKSGCADLGTDPKNCGVCEKSCAPSEYCSKGVCVTACAQGETKCGQSCVNLGTDRANCGVCGMVCAGAEECVAGLCKCTGANRVCDGVCTILTNNRNHCGSCDNRCQGQLVCKTRDCGCSGTKLACPNMPTTCVSNLNDCCPTGQVWCNDRCVSLKSDTNNCGSCGHSCPGAQKCNSGSCGCPSTQPKSCAGGVCLLAGQCCSNETKCGDKCIVKTTDSCCPSDPNPCGDDTKMCNTSNRCVCVVTCPNNQKCAAKLADCCPSGEDICGTGCCGPPNMCVNGSCKPPGPPDADPPGPDGGN
jgi:hypothetical protein